MKVIPTNIPKCYELQPSVFHDERGSFVKVFHENIFEDNQLETHFVEEYYSVSRRNVLRGLQFQLPPQDLVKMVYCVEGQVKDVVVDLRIGSPTYGKYKIFDLSAEKANIIYIPSGLAHGFYVTSEKAIMVYKVTTVYSPEYDTGIRWNSVGIDWDCKNPIVSQRDSQFVSFSEFNSPFTYL
jgi:dTDP-4-dehydrorhamnose 3,5-epimerase